MNIVLQIFQVIGLPAVISGSVALFLSRYFSKKDKSEELNEKIVDSVDKLNESIKALNEEIDEIENSIKEISDIIEVLKNADCALLRDRIVQMYNHYYVDKKSMPIYAKENLSRMYNAYHALGGNDIATELYEKMLPLPDKANN